MYSNNNIENNNNNEKNKNKNRNLLENSTYATDPFKYESFWPEGFGQLTNVNMNIEHEKFHLIYRYECIFSKNIFIGWQTNGI